MPITNGKYVNPGWVDGQAPAINASELNAISTTLENLDASGGSVSVRSPFIVIGTTENGATTETCDFLCDGIADDVEINAAISLSATTGQEIYILGGSYYITNTIQAPAGRGVIISGAGIGTTILIGAGASTVMEMYKSTLKNISIAGYNGETTSDILVNVSTSGVFENVSFYSFGQYGICGPDSGPSSNIFANNCSFQGIGKDACIYLPSTNGTFISNCYINGALYVSGMRTTISNSIIVGSTTLNQLRNSSITGCNFGNNVQLTESNFCSVSVNCFDGAYGISLDSQSTYNVVTGNGGGQTASPNSWAGVTDNGSNNYVANNMPTS